MGCYPRLVCSDWSSLCNDIDGLADQELVSLVAVTEAFAAPAQLEACFDRVRPYKEHFVVDLTRPGRRASRHHEYRVRRARRDGVIVERCAKPLELLDDWVRLYSCLARRHGITGLTAFSRSSLEMQLSVPGAAVFTARIGRITVAAHIWYIHGAVAYSHLQATDRAGLAMRASYALYAEALEWLAERHEYADLGSGAGSFPDSADGLSEFKRGWASEMRATHICERIFDRCAYDSLATLHGQDDSGYFPSYRVGELD